MDQATRGAKALEARDYPTAIQEFTSAIRSNSRAVKYYIQRSSAYQRSGDPRSALTDAEIAVKLAVDRANRELIAEAQLQRGKVLFALEQYANAQSVFAIVKAKNPKEKTVGIWEAKTQTKLKALEDGDERAQVTVVDVPNVHIPTEAELKNGNKKDDRDENNSQDASSKNTTAVTAAAAPRAQPVGVVPTPPNKIKHDWYQSTTQITLTILAKGVPKEKVVVDFSSRSLSLSFPTPNDSTYDLTLDPLFDTIAPAESSYTVMSTKIEIILKKETVGRKWASLEGSANELPSTTPANPVATNAAPSYPTSSKSGPKDWDKILQKPEGQKDEDDDGDPQDFFKMLYAGASEETKRAMMKSYVESNGTALSTNWDEVKKGPVETSPPDGMVAKKWNS